MNGLIQFFHLIYFRCKLILSVSSFSFQFQLKKISKLSLMKINTHKANFLRIKFNVNFKKNIQIVLTFLL